jgi:UDP-N-acetylglucosamine 2-epimerase (non-hydrolysing)
MKVFLILGTRPQIIKSASIIHEAAKNKSLKLEIIHTGQHYDYEMSKVFFDQFNLPDPIINLNVGSGSHAIQTAEIITKLEKVLIKNRPDCIIVPGDTNSALASALTSVKLGITVAHVEAGARSYDMSMAEEINRRVIDTISYILFAVSDVCASILKNENVPGRIFISGDTMYDVFLMFQDKFSKSEIIKRIDLKKEYCILTLHRAENVSNEKNLIEILSSIKEVCNKNDIQLVFPMHPRTRKIIASKIVSLKDIIITRPLSYIDMMGLLKEAKFIMTDSGGLQKEAFWLKVPCITLRDRTEWIETVKSGSNIISKPKKKSIASSISNLLSNYNRIKENIIFTKNPYGDGKASKKIIKVIESEVA